MYAILPTRTAVLMPMTEKKAPPAYQSDTTRTWCQVMTMPISELTAMMKNSTPYRPSRWPLDKPTNEITKLRRVMAGSRGIGGTQRKKVAAQRVHVAIDVMRQGRGGSLLWSKELEPNTKPSTEQRRRSDLSGSGSNGSSRP